MVMISSTKFHGDAHGSADEDDDDDDDAVGFVVDLVPSLLPRTAGSRNVRGWHLQTHQALRVQDE